MSDIAYQNKDITSKLFAERLKGKSLKVYGINIPAIKQVLPTNIPLIRANELRIDNVFLLEDGTVAIIDYESAYKKENKHKYIEYINYVTEYYSKEWKTDIQVRMIVIYTADVKRESTSDFLDAGCLQLEIESAYLSELDTAEISQRLNQKINEGEKLTEEELMQFIILPLAYKGNDEKNRAIENSINWVSKTKDEETKIFMLVGVAVFTDKVINETHAQEIWRMLAMTKVGQFIEKEKMEVLKKNAIEMLRDDMEVEKVAKYTSLSIEKVKEISRDLLQKSVSN